MTTLIFVLKFYYRNLTTFFTKKFDNFLLQNRTNFFATKIGQNFFCTHVPNRVVFISSKYRQKIVLKMRFSRKISIFSDKGRKFSELSAPKSCTRRAPIFDTYRRTVCNNRTAQRLRSRNPRTPASFQNLGGLRNYFARLFKTLFLFQRTSSDILLGWKIPVGGRESEIFRFSYPFYRHYFRLFQGCSQGRVVQGRN